MGRRQGRAGGASCECNDGTRSRLACPGIQRTRSGCAILLGVYSVMIIPWKRTGRLNKNFASCRLHEECRLRFQTRLQYPCVCVSYLK